MCSESAKCPQVESKPKISYGKVILPTQQVSLPGVWLSLVNNESYCMIISFQGQTEIYISTAG